MTYDDIKSRKVEDVIGMEVDVFDRFIKKSNRGVIIYISDINAHIKFESNYLRIFRWYDWKNIEEIK